jgi:hypothetical protein
MSTRFAVLVIVLALVTTGCIMSGSYHRPAPPRPAYYPPPPPPSSPSIDVGFFYDSLAPYGDWYLDAEFGWVWAPRGVRYGWRPYTEGYWLYTDYGWTWVSSWNWGWAPFHYGRWHFHPHRGWVWLPGRDWAPAWVAWRSGDGWVGWAPLPPGVRFRAGVGLDFGNARLDAMIDVHWWSFVEERRLTDRRLRSHVVPEPRNVTLVRLTRDVTRYEVSKNRIIVRGVDINNVTRASGHAVPRYILRDEPSRKETGPARISAGDVYMYRPAVREAGPDRTPPGHARKEQPAPAPRPTATAPERPATPTRAMPTRPATAPRPAAGSEDPERAKLEEQLRREQAELEREHRKQTTRPPANVSREELQRRQEQELKAFREKADRERTLREARAKEERQRAKEAKPPERAKEEEKEGRDASKTRGRKKAGRR